VQHYRPPSRLSTQAAAAYLGVATKTLANWRAQGNGPRYSKLVGTIRYDLVDLEQFVETHKVTPTARKAATGTEKPKKAKSGKKAGKRRPK